MNSKVSLLLGSELFQFDSFNNWVSTARRKFIRARQDMKLSTQSDTDVLCIDALGRVCLTGKQFKRAEHDNAFPIRCYQTLCGDERSSVCH